MINEQLHNNSHEQLVTNQNNRLNAYKHTINSKPYVYQRAPSVENISSISISSKVENK